MDIERVEAIIRQLEVAGRMKEIWDEHRNVRPSEKALREMRKKFRNAKTDKDRAEAWRWAQATTIIDLAEKYQSELN